MGTELRTKKILGCSALMLMVIWVMASVPAEGGLKQTDLFVSGRDGYKAYRIPALVVSNKGTILAICEARKNSFSDKGDIDLAIKRSFDNGQTCAKTRSRHIASPDAARANGQIGLFLTRSVDHRSNFIDRQSPDFFDRKRKDVFE